MSRPKPNAKLPAGAEMLPKPIRKKFGDWVEMVFDAKISRYGITWYRVKGGMGGDNSREDWVADLPFCASVHDYHWNGDSFGASYGSFEASLDAQMRQSRKYAAYQLRELEKEVATLGKALAQPYP